jgi:hypothetical protein
MMKEEKMKKDQNLHHIFFSQNIRPTIIYLFQFWYFQFVTNKKSNFFVLEIKH